MEWDKRRTKEDTWKSEELRKHLRASQPDSQNEDQKHREKKLQKEKSFHDTDARKHEHRDRGKSKERTRERETFKSGERDRDRMRERERGKEHQRRDQESCKDKLQESSLKKERHGVPKDKDRESDKERDKRHKRHEIKQIDTQDNLKSLEGRDKEHHRRRESRHRLEEEKTRSEERERRHIEKKDNDTKTSIDKILAYRAEEAEHVHKLQKDQELDKKGERRHREKKEHSVRPGKERLSKERSHRHYEKEEKEKHKSKRSKEGSSHGDREGQPAEANERVKSRENERKKSDVRNSKYKEEERIQEEMSHQCVSTVKDREKLVEKEEKDRRQEDMKDTHICNSDMGFDNFSANYEDDFEDYEDDYEEKSGEERDAEENLREIPVSRTSEVEEIRRAISAENDRIYTSLPKKIENEKKEPIMERQYGSVRNSFRGIFMDFQTANQRQSSRSMANKQKKRSSELLPLIDLDFSVSFSLLDLPPVNEYDMYIRSFGKMNTKQAYVQCNEDNLERDIQTEEVETLEKWTQHPGESALVSGGPINSQDMSVNGALTPQIDSQRLANFLRSACQVIAVLLEEDQVSTQPRWKQRSGQTSLSISDSCFQLNTNQPFLHDRKISCLYVSQVQRQALLSVHGLPEKAGLPVGLLNRKSIICIWNIWQPSSPQKVLICDSEVICCCFSPNKATLVFAGTIDGSLLVWDLREDSRMHHHMMISETDWTFRVPTFSTDGVLNSVNHTAPILAVEPVSTSLYTDQNYRLSSPSYQEEISGPPFQIASMDENGILNMWVVVELQKVDLAGSQTDLGLIPGGRVKLVHSSTVELNNSLFPKDVHQRMPQTLTIKFLSSNPNHFIVGTNIGLVGHGTRHDLKVFPKLFRPQESGLRTININAIDFFPFGKPLFLVGCSDGSIRLHQMTSDYPLMQWNDSTNGQPVIALQWALTRPAVFFVLDASSNIYIWDLLEDDLLPVAKQTIPSENVVTMALLGEPEKTNGLLGIALAKESGEIDIQYVKKKWALPQPEESERLHLVLLQSF
ncbi:cytoplasmic dynein 2 intermediate chain 1 [Aegotheles albertisi]